MAAASFFRRISQLGMGLIATGAVASTALYNVEGGQRAVIFDRFSGVKPLEVGEGTHFFIPLVQKPYIFDIRSQPRNIQTITGSKDLQTVNITVRILYRPIASKLSQIFTNLGMDYDERVLPSITNEILKAVVAQYDASELITQREVVSHQISEDLRRRSAQFAIILDDVSITHLTFGKEFIEAVELKQVAQLEAERWRYIVEKEEEIKKAAITRAEGDSKAAEILSRAFAEAGEGLVELRKLEASLEVAKQLSQSDNVVYLPEGPQILLNKQ